MKRFVLLVATVALSGCGSDGSSESTPGGSAGAGGSAGVGGAAGSAVGGSGGNAAGGSAGSGGEAGSGGQAGSGGEAGSAGGPLPDLELCGVREPGPPPKVTPAMSSSTGGEQDPAHCGSNVPTLDLAADDPFASIRYDVPSDYLSSPFEVCQQALKATLGSRPLCSEVDDKATWLVSKQGDADPRWDATAFEGVRETIQGAVDSAKHCDTIVVRPGVYKEYLSIRDKDVRIVSDTWNEDGTAEDGDERVTYTAERIDLLHYYETGERVVQETRETFMKPLKRATRTVLEGGGYEEGPDLGGTIERNHDDPTDPNRGCGNRRPMVDFVAGTTRNTVFDGFTVRLMPEQDHTIPGHGHTLQCRGGSPIIRNNVIYNNGSTGVGVHANFVVTEPVVPPCEHDSSLEQETFRNDDYRAGNLGFRPVPLVYGNISYQNNGLGLGNNHYSCAAMVGNEAFWNAVPEALGDHQSPGIGTRHGAKTCIDRNIVYENAWTGIAVRQGYLQPKDACAEDPVNCNHIDERTQAVVARNVVFDNGMEGAPEDSKGAIAVDGVGLPDEPVHLHENVVFDSQVSGVAVRNEYAGEDRGFVMDDSFVLIEGNTAFGNARQGITCKGSEYGRAYCTVVGNDAYWNGESGIGFKLDAAGGALHNVAACNAQSGIQTKEVSGDGEIAIYNNIVFANVRAGILDAGETHDYNLYSANAGQPLTCGDGPQANACKNPQSGNAEGGTAGEHDLFVDPEFVGATEFDYAVPSGSPAVDSGTDAGQYCSWPAAGSAPDRGSHEQ